VSPRCSGGVSHSSAEVFQLHDLLETLFLSCRTSPLPINTTATATHQSFSALRDLAGHHSREELGLGAALCCLTNRTAKIFLKAGWFLKGGEEVSSGGRVVGKDRHKQGAGDMRNYSSDFLLSFPQTDPL